MDSKKSFFLSIDAETETGNRDYGWLRQPLVRVSAPNSDGTLVGSSCRNRPWKNLLYSGTQVLNGGILQHIVALLFKQVTAQEDKKQLRGCKFGAKTVGGISCLLESSTLRQC